MKRGILLSFVLLFLLGGTLVISAKEVYPLKGDVTLTYWMELNANVALVAKNFGDTEFAKELQKRTGVKVKFLHPAAGQAKEAFNLMLASGDLPDIIEYNWYEIPGGPNNALQNGQIVALNSIFDKYAPNLKSFLKKNPDHARKIRTDEGRYYVFPFFRGEQGDTSLLGLQGPIVRKDWLDELGLPVPETIDDWYVTLKAFKEKKNATIPLGLEPKNLTLFFAGGFDNSADFYVEKGKVKFGGIEPNRKQYFETMRKWYSEGLLDRNFSTTTRKILDANVLTGKTGVTYGAGGSGVGRYMESMRDKDPKFSLIGAPFPGPKKGVPARFAYQSPAYGRNSTGSVAISTKCKNVEAAARLLDYGYSREGHMLYNFGIEGVSYKMVDKYPTYTELIMKNPEKLSNTQVMSKYMRSHTSGPFIQDKRYLEQYYEWPQQKVAMVNWKKNDYVKYVLPPVTPTPEESSELARIMNEVQTYSDEMSYKFIMGTEPIENFNQYVAQVKKLGIDRAVQIYQASLDRYNKRK